MKFSIKDLFSKCDQIRRFLRIWSYILKKSLMENFIFVQCVSLDIRYGTIQIKQYHTVTYLVYALGENLSGETMALKVIRKINCRLRFLYRKNRFSSKSLRRLLCIPLIHYQFDYACSAWYPKLDGRLKSKLQILRNKCICFCLNLNSRAHICLTEFEKIN